MNRARFEEALNLASDRLDAADVLDRTPHRAESLRVLAHGLHALEAAIALLDSEVMAQLFQRQARDLADFRQRLEAAPESDAQLSKTDLQLWREARSVALRTHGRLWRATRTRQSVIARRVIWSSAPLAGIAALIFVLSLRDRFVVTASSRYSALFGAQNAIDGNDTTDWLAPDNASAWLDLKYRKPIDVTEVRVVNAHNAPYDDRATKDLEVSLFSGDQLVKHAQITLPDAPKETKSITIPIVAANVTRIRFLTRTHYGKGAGLAEISVIEAKR